MIFTNRLKLNSENRNGRIYTNECVTQALNSDYFTEQFNNKCLFVTLPSSDIIDGVYVNKIGASLKSFEIQENNVLFTYETLNTPCGKIIESLALSDKLYIVPCGYGNVTESGIVEDYALYSFSVVDSAEDSFKVNINEG